MRIIGTGHILQKSVDDVRNALSEDVPDFVAVELDVRRFRVLEEVTFQPEKYKRDINFKDVLSSFVGGGSFPVFVQGVIGLLQKDLGERYGISPGSDMCAAIVSAREMGAVVALIDRDIEVTINCLLSVPLKELFGLFTSRGGEETRIVVGLLNNDIAGLLEEENLQPIIKEFRKRLPSVYTALIDERDAYMAYMLYRLQQQHPEKNILAVVGAGHKEGITRYMEDIRAGYVVNVGSLTTVKKVSILKALIMAGLVFLAFILIKTESLIRRK